MSLRHPVWKICLTYTLLLSLSLFSFPCSLSLPLSLTLLSFSLSLSLFLSLSLSLSLSCLSLSLSLSSLSLSLSSLSLSLSLSLYLVSFSLSLSLSFSLSLSLSHIYTDKSVRNACLTYTWTSQIARTQWVMSPVDVRELIHRKGACGSCTHELARCTRGSYLHMCEATRSCGWCDLFLRVMWLVCMCAVTRSRVWHDSLM